MFGRLSPSASFLKIFNQNAATFILKVSQHYWVVFKCDNEDSEFKMSEVSRGRVPDHTVTDCFFVPYLSSVNIVLLSPEKVIIIDISNPNTIHHIDNIGKFSMGCFHYGLGASLIHNGKELRTLFTASTATISSNLSEKPWNFVFDKQSMKVLGDFQMEYMSNMHVLAANTSTETKSLTLLLEYRVSSTNCPLIHWNSIQPEENKVILRWRIPLFAPDVAATLFYNSQGVEMCLIFNGGTLLAATETNLLQTIDWHAFGTLTAFGNVHTINDKCFFLAAYNTGGIHGNELDLQDGMVSVSPLEGVGIFGTLTLPVARQFHSIVYQNWKSPNFEYFAIIGDPFVGFSLLYTESFATRVSPEFLASMSRNFDFMSHSRAISMGSMLSSYVHSRHKLFLDEDEVIQTIRQVHPSRIVGSYFVEGCTLADYRLLPMEAVSSLCPTPEDSLFVLTSRSYRCSILLRLRQNGDFDVLSGILVENDVTLAIFKLHDRRVVQVTSKQILCFTINAQRQWVLETKCDVAFSAKQQQLQQRITNIFHVAKYRDKLWLSCDHGVIAQLSCGKLPTVDIQFVNNNSSSGSSASSSGSQEIAAMQAIATGKAGDSNSSAEWLALALWDTPQVHLRRFVSSSSTESIGIVQVVPTTDAGAAVIKHIAFLKCEVSEHLVFAASLSDGRLLVYLLNNHAQYSSSSSSIQYLQVATYALSEYAVALTVVHEDPRRAVVLVSTVTGQMHQLTLWFADVFASSTSLFASIHSSPKLQFGYLPNTQFQSQITHFGGILCRDLSVLAPHSSSSLSSSARHINKTVFVGLTSPESLRSTAAESRPSSMTAEHRDAETKHQTSKLQQLLIVKGDIAFDQVCHQSLAISDRYLDISQTLHDERSRRLFVLHWIPNPAAASASVSASNGAGIGISTGNTSNTSHSTASAAADSGHNGSATAATAEAVQQLDILDSMTLEVMYSIRFDAPHFGKLSFAWKPALRPALHDLFCDRGVITSVTLAPTSPWLFQPRLLQDHIVEILSRLEPPAATSSNVNDTSSSSSSSSNKRRGSKSNSSLVHAPPVASPQTGLYPSSFYQAVYQDYFAKGQNTLPMKPLTTVVVDTQLIQTPPPQPTTTTTASASSSHYDDSNSDDDDDDDDDQYLDPAVYQLLHASSSSTGNATTTVHHHQGNRRARPRCHSTVTVASFLCHNDGAFLATSVSSHSSGNASSSSSSSSSSSFSSSAAMYPVLLVPLDAVEWPVLNCDLFRHPPLTAPLLVQPNTTTTLSPSHESSSQQSAFASSSSSSSYLMDGDGKVATEQLAVLTVDGCLSVVGWAVSLLAAPTSSSSSCDEPANGDANTSVSLATLEATPVRSGTLRLQRLAHVCSTLSPMIPPKFTIDYSEPERALRDIARLEEERQWRRAAKPQLHTRGHIAVVYVPRVGFEVYRLRSVYYSPVTNSAATAKQDAQITTSYELELCAAVRDNMDLERVFVLFHSNAQGDAVVKVLGHDRILAKRDEERAIRLHSFTLVESERYFGGGDGNMAMRRDAFAPIPAGVWTQHGVQEVLFGSSERRQQQQQQQQTAATTFLMSFADFHECMDVAVLLAASTVVDCTGHIHYATYTNTQMSLETGS